MTLKLEIERLKQFLVLGLLFLASMNVASKFFYFVFFSFFVILMTQRKLKMDPVSLLYLALCVLMSIGNRKEGMMSMIRCLAPFCFYLVGLNLIPFDAPHGLQLSEKQGYSILTVISLGSFSHYMLNYLYNLGSSHGRNTNDIWSGQIMAATGQNALACLMLGLACAMLFLPRRKWHRWAGAAMICMMLMYNMVLSGRTLLVMLGILLLIGMLYPQQNTRYSAQLMKYLALFALVGLVIAAAYLLNIGGFQDYVRDSLFFSRFGGSIASLLDNTSRNHAKLAFLSHMLDYPFGGCHMRSMYGYAHDLLLDAHDEYGILVFLLLVMILSTGALGLYHLLRRTGYGESFKLSALLVYCSILLEFTVEPILAGMPWVFACYCLINGCITGMNLAQSRNANKGAKIHLQ